MAVRPPILSFPPSGEETRCRLFLIVKSEEVPVVVFRNRLRFAATARMASSWQCACLKIVLNILVNQKKYDLRLHKT